MELYFKLRILFDYIIPLGIVALIVIGAIILNLTQDKEE